MSIIAILAAMLLGSANYSNNLGFLLTFLLGGRDALLCRARAHHGPAQLALIAQGTAWGMVTPLFCLQAPQLLDRVRLVRLTQGRFSRNIALIVREGAFGGLPARIWPVIMPGRLTSPAAAMALMVGIMALRALALRMSRMASDHVLPSISRASIMRR